MERLITLLVDDATRALRREDDQARNEARELKAAAQAHVDELMRAAKDLGRVRGEAHETTLQAEADAEVADVAGAAFEALAERFERRVLLALAELGGDVSALAGWAAQSVPRMDGPAEVFCAKRDRRAVYDALLAAGATDFQVLTDHRTHVGFVVRDLDGRTLVDCRPEGLLDANREALRALLKGAVPAYTPSGT
jgi:vacuolar-type H+-ATPase subunit E/Vma4